jgi:Zn-dependent oligopeptidase
MNTKLDKTKLFDKQAFDDIEFQTFLVHMNQTIVWMQMLNSFKPKGKLKERLRSSINNLSALSSLLPVSDDLFERAVDISDSLFKMTSLNDEQQKQVVELINKQINDLQ